MISCKKVNVFSKRLDLDSKAVNISFTPSKTIRDYIEEPEILGPCFFHIDSMARIPTLPGHLLLCLTDKSLGCETHGPEPVVGLDCTSEFLHVAI